MSVAAGGAGELVLHLEAVDPNEIPSMGTITWWS